MCACVREKKEPNHDQRPSFFSWHVVSFLFRHTSKKNLHHHSIALNALKSSNVCKFMRQTLKKFGDRRNRKIDIGIVIANLSSTCVYINLFFFLLHRWSRICSLLLLFILFFSSNFDFDSLFPVFSFLSPLSLVSKIRKLSNSAVTYGDTIYRIKAIDRLNTLTKRKLKPVRHEAYICVYEWRLWTWKTSVSIARSWLSLLSVSSFWTGNDSDCDDHR